LSGNGDEVRFTVEGVGTGTRFHDPDMREWESGRLGSPVGRHNRHDLMPARAADWWIHHVA